MAKRLLDADQEWVKFFIKTAFFKGGQGLQSVFVNLFINRDITDLIALWNRFNCLIFDDF